MGQKQNVMYREYPVLIRDVTAAQFAVQATAAPEHPGVMYRVDDGAIYRWNGSDWVADATWSGDVLTIPGFTMGGDVDADGNDITGLGAMIADDTTLAAINQSVFSATIVDTFLYDTSKDSDGGAWRHRCGHTSWENETLSGNWLGSAANETAARAISGATTGSYYYDTTALGFYTLNAGSGKTATYRGNVRQFPAKVLITVEAARVALWDLTQAGAPMWMVFALSAGGTSTVLGRNVEVITSVSAVNGLLAVGRTTAGEAGLLKIEFLSDSARRYGAAVGANGLRTFAGNLAARNTAAGFVATNDSMAIVDFTVNDVAMTVLPNAPVDVATGLQVPTIAVATNGGVSVIKDDGTVENRTEAGTIADAVLFDNYGGLWAGYRHKAGAIGLQAFSYDSPEVSTAGKRTYGHTVSVPNIVGGYAGGSSGFDTFQHIAEGRNLTAFGFQAGSAEGLSLLVQDRSSIADGMVAYVTKDYNSGWQVGAIKGAWLADTVAETLTGAELVTNGDFATNLTGWTLSASTPPTWNAAGAMQFNSDGVTFSTAEQTLTTVSGKTYTLSLSMASGSQIYVYVGTSSGAFDLVNGSIAATGNYAFTFTASSTTSYLKLIDGAAITNQLIDNVTCRLADVDRSVNANGLQIHGSITKAAVASGAELVGYSGFSAANYLEQPYNADLDFGTGDFYYMFWLIEANNIATEVALERGDYDGSWHGAGFQIALLSNGVITILLTDDGFATYDNQASSYGIDDSVPRLVVWQRVGSVTELWVNDAKAANDMTITNASGSLSNANATLRAGCDHTTTPLSSGTLALLRAGAGSLSAEQIAKIYRDELPLFQANAACTLAGSSNAVTALAYDEDTDLLHVGTSYGRSTFHGLELVESEATAVGAITALSAVGGIIAQGGAMAVDVYVPAQNLREELARTEEHAAGGIEFFDFTATASQTDFALEPGWELMAVYQQGALKRETTSWTREFNGFYWTAVLGTGATVSDWVSIMARRTK